MHFKYNLLIVFEIEEFNFVLYCRNKCILRRPPHDCGFFLREISISSTHSSVASQTTESDRNQGFSRWGTSRLEESLHGCARFPPFPLIN